MCKNLSFATKKSNLKNKYNENTRTFWLNAVTAKALSLSPALSLDQKGGVCNERGGLTLLSPHWDFRVT